MAFNYAKFQHIIVAMLAKLTIDKLGRIVLPKAGAGKVAAFCRRRIGAGKLGRSDHSPPVARHSASEKKTRCLGLQFRRAAFGRYRPGDHRASAPRTRRYQSCAVEVLSVVRFASLR